MENLQGTLYRLEGRLGSLRRGSPVDGLVIQLKSFGQPCERHAHIMGHLLRVNTPGRLVVQLGEDDLQPTGATEYGLQFFLYGEDSTLEFGHSVQEVGIIFNYCCCHG